MEAFGNFLFFCDTETAEIQYYLACLSHILKQCEFKISVANHILLQDFTISGIDMHEMRVLQKLCSVGIK